MNIARIFIGRLSQHLLISHPDCIQPALLYNPLVFCLCFTEPTPIKDSLGLKRYQSPTVQAQEHPLEILAFQEYRRFLSIETRFLSNLFVFARSHLIATRGRCTLCPVLLVCFICLVMRRCYLI